MDIQEILEIRQSELRKKLNEENNQAEQFLISAELLQIDERLARLNK